MKRHAAVIKFHPDVTTEEIAKALNLIKHVIDVPATAYESESYTGDDGKRYARGKEVPFRWGHLVQEYDDQYGDPVFYIP